MSDLTLPWDDQPGEPENIDHVMENDEALRDEVNDLDVDNLNAALQALLGLTATGSVRRGKSIIDTEEARTNTAYGLLTTPDQVSGVIMPTDGLMFILYQAAWKESVNGAARAAIFLGANQIRRSTGTPAVQETSLGAVDTYTTLYSSYAGLKGEYFGSAWVSEVDTGQIVGYREDGDVSTDNLSAIIPVRAAAGSYDVSVQFKASSGSVTVKERKLWVWTMGF